MLVTAGNTVVLIIALLHIYILVLEMFMWQTPKAMRAFGTTVEFAEQTKAMAANQGLYNGFLAAGLLWGWYLGEAGYSIKLFFLGCVLVAGIYGAATVNKKILFIQSVPALIGISLLFLS